MVRGALVKSPLYESLDTWIDLNVVFSEILVSFFDGTLSLGSGRAGG